MLFRKKKKREVPALDTTSTADISFMLLIFFLVTTSLDTDEGLSRHLPPMPQKEEQKQADVNRRDLMSVDIDAADRVTCDGREVSTGELTRLVEDFAEKRGKRHLISLTADRNTSYDTYFHVQNAIVEAYARQRDRTARREYHIPYSQCSEEQRRRVAEMCPQRISENELTATDTEGQTATGRDAYVGGNHGKGGAR